MAPSDRMSEDRWNQVRRLLDAALELSPSERSRYLEGRTDVAPEVRREVQSLLAVEVEAEFLENSPPGLTANTSSESLETRDSTEKRPSGASMGAVTTTPERIGPYLVGREIGAGGMGVVYEAMQEEPVRRPVALKLIKWGMDTKAVIGRFESERQAIALMQHPNIASVYDAGATEEGRPYFAMEYVEGVPLTRYCDEHRSSLRERLELFMRVCEGVEHAHQKGIIHRDLKPSNVLVTLASGQPTPKIIDFGLAKATSQRLTENSIYTELGQLVGTPEYMSPEQADIQNLDIDTRTDVYSLGVLLYELLTGVRPFDPGVLRKAGLTGILKTLQAQDPPTPSTRLSRLGAEADELAALRRAEVRTLKRALRGDLDWIVMKALEKDRARRYQSAAAMSADLKRYLEHEPVEARAPSTSYRLGKFVRRHRGKVMALSAMSILAVGFVIAYTINISRARNRAEQEARKARAINAFLQDTLGSANPHEGMGRAVTVVEVLDRAASEMDGAFGDQPEVEAALRSTLGFTYLRLGEIDKAESLLRQALEMRRASAEAEPGELTESLFQMGRLVEARGDYPGAGALYQEGLELARQHHPDGDLSVVKGLNELASAYDSQGQLDLAGALFREAVELSERLFGESHVIVAESQFNYGMHLYRQADFEAAEPLLRKAYAIRVALLGEDHPTVAESLDGLATLLGEKGQYEEAEKLMRAALDRSRRLLGPEHPETAISINNLAFLLYDKGDLEASIDLYREALTIYRKVYEEDHPLTASTMTNLASALRFADQLPEAESLLREALEIRINALGADHADVATTYNSLAAVVRVRGRMPEAMELQGKALETFEKSLPPEHWRVANARSRWGAFLIDAGRFPEAETALLVARRDLAAAFGDDAPRTLAAVRRLVRLYEAWGKDEKAAEYRALLAP